MGSDVLDGFLSGLGEGLIDAGKYVVKDSFESKAYERKEAIQQKMWEERNATTNAQKTEAADLAYDRSTELADTKNERAVEAARVKEGGLNSRNSEDNSAKVAAAKVKATVTDSKDSKALRVPAKITGQLSDLKSGIKALDKVVNATKPGAAEEDPDRYADAMARRATAREYRDVIQQTENLLKAGKKDEAKKVYNAYKRKLEGLNSGTK